MTLFSYMGVQPSGKNWWPAIKEHGMKIVLKRKWSKMLVILNKKWELPNTNVYLAHAKQKRTLSPIWVQYHDQVDTKLFNIDIKLICEKRHINTEVSTYLPRIHDRHHLHNNHLHSLSTIHIMIISLGLRHKFFFFLNCWNFEKVA
jgi:hypothetical protein